MCLAYAGHCVLGGSAICDDDRFVISTYNISVTSRFSRVVMVVVLVVHDDDDDDMLPAVK